MFKNIFLITIDCLRADFLGCIGGKKNLTPNIDNFAKKSLLFTRAFSTGPGTRQSFPAILSSTYLHQHAGMRLLQGKVTLAEVLRGTGFKTVGFHSNPFLSRPLGWGRGFNEFYDYLEDIRSPSKVATKFQESKILKKMARFIFKLFGDENRDKLMRLFSKIYYKSTKLDIPYLEARLITKEVINWLDKNHSDKLFLWMHYMDPHYPYIPPEEYLEDFVNREEAFNFNIKINYKNPLDDEVHQLKRLYLGEVRYVDEYLQKFLDFLDEKQYLENSLVILTADHGNAFMEHGRFAHAYDILYNEVIHVPLIIYGLESKGIIDTNISLIDLPPTILDVLNITKPNSFMGKSLLTNIKNHRDSHPRPIFSESAKPDFLSLTHDIKKMLISCIYNNWKLIKNDIWGTTELYNLDNDFFENNNVVINNIKQIELLSNFIKKHLCHKI